MIGKAGMVVILSALFVVLLVVVVVVKNGMTIRQVAVASEMGTLG